MKQPDFRVEREKRYHVVNGKKERRRDRPGDLVIDNWQFDEDNIGRLYLDVTVGNIFSKSYVNQAAGKRLWLAEKLER